MPTTPSHGHPTILQQEHASGDAGLRLIFGLIALPAASWLLLVDTRPVPRLAALLALIFSGLWFFRFMKHSRQTPATLELNAETLILKTQGTRHIVPWTDILRIEIDHDALVLYLVIHNRPELRIEPGFAGLGLCDLAEKLQNELIRARTCEPESDG